MRTVTLSTPPTWSTALVISYPKLPPPTWSTADHIAAGIGITKIQLCRQIPLNSFETLNPICDFGFFFKYHLYMIVIANES